MSGKDLWREGPSPGLIRRRRGRRLGRLLAAFFVFEVGAPGGGNQIFRVDLDATLGGIRLSDILDGFTDLWLVNRADVGFTALFDWGEISGEEISADAGGGVGPSSGASRAVDAADADRVRALTGAPAAFPHSVVLCGVRDVRDYRIHSGSGRGVGADARAALARQRACA